MAGLRGAGRLSAAKAKLTTSPPHRSRVSAQASRGRRSWHLRLGDGAEAGGGVDSLAIGIAADVGVLVTEADEAMAGDSERLVVQGGADGAEDLVRLLLAPCAGPDVHSEDVLRAVLAARRPVLRRHASEGDVGERGALGHVIEDAARTEERGERGVGAEGSEDGLLEGPHGGVRW